MSASRATSVVGVRRWYLRMRLLAAWRGAELDRQLAAGVEPQSSLLLALRARKLISDRSRRRVARGLVRAYRNAQQATPCFTAAVRPNARELLPAQGLLAAIDRRLRSPAPIRAEGIAIIEVLLTDGASPLYQDVESGTLMRQLQAATAALEPR
jgi:hypothetical protein